MALSAQQNERERQKQELALALQAQQDKFDAAKARELHEQDLAMSAQAFEQRLLLAGKQDEATLAALTRMKDIGVDLNRYLETLAVSARDGHRRPGKVGGNGEGGGG